MLTNSVSAPLPNAPPGSNTGSRPYSVSITSSSRRVSSRVSASMRTGLLIAMTPKLAQSVNRARAHRASSGERACLAPVDEEQAVGESPCAVHAAPAILVADRPRQDRARPARLRYVIGRRVGLAMRRITVDVHQ